jgi:hypothetical protein
VSPDTIFGTVREIGDQGAESKPESKADALMASANSAHPATLQEEPISELPLIG